jgi:hypothetical protein
VTIDVRTCPWFKHRAAALSRAWPEPGHREPLLHHRQRATDTFVALHSRRRIRRDAIVRSAMDARPLTVSSGACLTIREVLRRTAPHRSEGISTEGSPRRAPTIDRTAGIHPCRAFVPTSPRALVDPSRIFGLHNRMASTGRKENGGFRQLACQSGHSRPRCLMAALDPSRTMGRPIGRSLDRTLRAV